MFSKNKFDIIHKVFYHLVRNGGGDEVGEELAGAGGDRPRMRGVARLSRARPGSPLRVVEVPDRDRAQAHERPVARVLGVCLRDFELRSICDRFR